MKISALAGRSGVASKSIRYYESQGLLASPPRQDNGYRDYPESAVAELTFLRQARQFGFTLDECRSLLTLWHNPERRSVEVHDLVRSRQNQVAQQISELEATQQLLTQLLSKCSADDSADCGIIDSLSKLSTVEQQR